MCDECDVVPDSGAYYIRSALRLSLGHPDTFHYPEDLIARIRLGDLVKISIVDDHGRADRMWGKVFGVGPGALLGIELANYPTSLAPLERGSRLTIAREHVYDMCPQEEFGLLEGWTQE